MELSAVPRRICLLLLALVMLAAALPAAAKSPRGSHGNPIPLGQSARLVDGSPGNEWVNWVVKVTKISPNAWPAIEPSTSNDPPKAGRTFFMAWVVATYRGSQARDSLSGGEFDVTAGSTKMSGTLSMNASLALSHGEEGPFGDISCQQADECAGRHTRGAFPGLGQVDGRYDFPMDACPGNQARPLAYPIRLTVAGKGEIQIAVAAGPCVEFVPNSTQSFTVTGGTGSYAGASGSGTLARSLSTGNIPRYGTETWTGTLEGPGLEFDVTRPTLTGATSKKVQGEEGREVCPRRFPRDGAGRPGRRLVGLMRPALRVRLPNRQNPGELHRERFERQRRQGVVHRHRPAPPVARPRKRRPERSSGAGRRECWGSQVEVRRLAVGRARRYGTD